MKFLIFSFLLFAFVSAGVDDILGGLREKIEEKVEGTIDKLETNVDTLANSICSPDPERQLKTIAEEIDEAWKSVVKAFTLVSGVPKVIYDEAVQEAINSFEQIKSDATNSITNIKIEMPTIPKEVDLGGGIVVPLS